MARHTVPDFIERVDTRPASARPTALNLVLSLRPTQWTKNLIILLPLMLAQRLLDGHALLYAVAAFVIFCALSGVVYLINDIADREADRRHPIKKDRPIASGALPVPVAIGVGRGARRRGPRGRVLAETALRGRGRVVRGAPRPVLGPT